MADKAISQLNAASSVTSVDLFVLEQSGEAKKLSGQILENWLVSFADGHGGIQSITKTGSTGTNPVIDTYTILLADETTTTFQVVNGIKGDTGDQTYVWIRYAHTYPTADSDMGTSPDEWIGIYSGTSTTAPTHYTDYTWYQFKGETGDTGAAATITAATIGYQQSDSGSVVPEGSWVTTVPTPVAGKFLWTRIQIQFNTGSPITAYSVARYGIDGTGAVSSVNSVSPDGNGNVQLLASDIQASDSTSIQAHLTDIETDVSGLQTSINGKVSDTGDTMTGDLIIDGGYFVPKSSNLTNGTTVPSNTMGNGRIQFKDSLGNALGILYPLFHSDGKQGMRFIADRFIGATEYTASLELGVASDGTKYVELPNSTDTAFLKALGLYSVETETVASNIATASTGYSIQTASYVRWGHVAMVYLGIKRTSGVSSDTSLQPCTLVSGKRPAFEASVTSRNVAVKTAYFSSGGTLNTYQTWEAGATLYFTSTFIVP